MKLSKSEKFAYAALIILPPIYIDLIIIDLRNYASIAAAVVAASLIWLLYAARGGYVAMWYTIKGYIIRRRLIYKIGSAAVRKVDAEIERQWRERQNDIK